MKIIFICLIIFMAITGAFIIYDIENIKNGKYVRRKSPQTMQQPTQTPVKKTARLYFSDPEFIATSSASRSAQVDILMQSGDSDVSGAQIELKYDPASLIDITATNSSNSFFGEITNYAVLFNEVDRFNGRISYAVAINPGGTPKRGTGKVATLTLTFSPKASSSAISFAPTTLVTKLGTRSTILQEATNLIVTPKKP